IDGFAEDEGEGPRSVERRGSRCEIERKRHRRWIDLQQAGIRSSEWAQEQAQIEENADTTEASHRGSPRTVTNRRPYPSRCYLISVDDGFFADHRDPPAVDEGPPADALRRDK